MTRSLSLFSEPYGTTGNIGENFRRLLGAPSLDPLQTVIREAVQNIADAAKLGTGPEIAIRLRRLTPDQQSVFSSRVVRELPKNPLSSQLVAVKQSCQGLVVMEICDFGTIGLGGPTRSDRIPVGASHTDFIQFLRDIGTARDTKQGGGTYGFGKVALYRASRCSTVIVDTLPHGTGPEGRRLIGCHIGPSFDLQENGMLRRFTGRHWWGLPDPDDGVVDPITGEAARVLASGLGLPARDAGKSGTSIMILDFETDGEDLAVLGNRVVEGLLWNFWPRMMRDAPPDRRFNCRVEIDGSPLPIPFPEDFPPLDMFTKAMRAARSGAGNNVRGISSERPAKFLGSLAIERGLRTPRRPLVGDRSLFPIPSRHIALMRPVELVVKYLEGGALPDERLEWAGVFIASSEDEVERAFADSEPPAHDDWIPNNLPKGNPKRYVNIALNRIRTVASEMGLTVTGQPGASATSSPPLAHLAGRLGAALEDVGGEGAGRKRSTGGGRKKVRPRRARATRPLFQRLYLTEHGRVAVFLTEVSQNVRRTGSFLVARAAVAIEGSSASRFDDNIRQPAVLSIRSDDGSLLANSDRLALSGSEGIFEIRVLVLEDYAVTIEVEVVMEADV